jgi:hypothetical protein
MLRRVSYSNGSGEIVAIWVAKDRGIAPGVEVHTNANVHQRFRD